MGETKAQLVGEIEGARYALDRDLTALETRVHEEMDVRLQLQRHPWVLPAAIIGLGLMLGLIVAKLRRGA